MQALCGHFFFQTFTPKRGSHAAAQSYIFKFILEWGLCLWFLALGKVHRHQQICPIGHQNNLWMLTNVWHYHLTMLRLSPSLLWTNAVSTVYRQPSLNVYDDETDLPRELLSFPILSFSLDGSTGNLSSSTIMDILRNKAWTWKVSNQQHIFQKMADPILYMSLRPPLNCWCADPSLIWCRFSQPRRSFSNCFCLLQPVRWASIGGKLTTCPSDIQYSTLKTCKPPWPNCKWSIWDRKDVCKSMEYVWFWHLAR